MWQHLLDSLDPEKFTILAIAEDSRGADAARPWIEAARPTYPTLIDVEHRVSALYGMVNVPQAVWIDETGHIVRPPETTGSTDHFRRMDRTTRTLAPEHAAARLDARHAYMQAVRDWVATNRYALPEDAARAKLPPITPDIAHAHAEFRLGIWLRRHNHAAADTHLAEASRLHPDSWNMWRQAAPADAAGFASGAQFWARVDALGERAYYPAPEL